jgi:Protein of unknown function (DUF1681)
MGRADSWPSEPMWTGRLMIKASDESAAIELRESATGDLFAACPIKRDGPQAVIKGTFCQFSVTFALDRTAHVSYGSR